MNTSLEIPIGFELLPEKTYEPNEEIDLGAVESNKQYSENLTGTLKSITISLLTFTCEILADTSTMGKGDCYDLELSINAEGGAVETYGGVIQTDTDNNKETHRKSFSVPINPDDITPVTICGKNISLK